MLRTLFLMAMSFALSFSVTTVLILLREHFLPAEKRAYWHEENDLLRW
jgi:hypothetical protein